jgi:hypothetical protein
MRKPATLPLSVTWQSTSPARITTKNMPDSSLKTWDAKTRLVPSITIFISYKKTEKGYVVTARPEKYGVSGKLSLYSDQTAVIRATLEDREATVDDPPVSN